MKIMSLNINFFNGDKESFKKFKDNILRQEYGGKYSYEAYKDVLSRWDCISKRPQIEQLLEIVKEESPDVLIFQEFDINSPADEKSDFENEMKKMGYERKNNSVQGERPSYTAVYCLDYDGDSEEAQFSVFEGRMYILRYKGFLIIGAHMPFHPKDSENPDQERTNEVEKLWAEITDYLSKKRLDKVMLIGDLNVFDRGTHQFNSFIRLFRSDVGMRDLWLELDNRDNTPTFKICKNRLDYALLTPGILKSYKCEMRLIPEKDEEFLSEKWDLSDHRILIVEIEEDEKNE